MPELLPYLEAAAAHPDFKREVIDFVRGGSATRIELEGYAPRVKVERVLTQLLHAHPDLAVERVALAARSGCSDFTGEIVAHASAGGRTASASGIRRARRASMAGAASSAGSPSKADPPRARVAARRRRRSHPAVAITTPVR